MADIRQTVIDMLKTPQLSNMASISLDGKPWTRYIMIQSDEDFTIRASVSLQTRKIKQIESNPEVHLCFGVNDPQDMTKPYVQIQGKAKFTSDQQEKNKLWTDMLEKIFSGPQDPNYAIIIIEPYRVEFMNPGAMIPEVWEK